MSDLDRYTWDQATIAGLATARGFMVYAIPAVTIRRWAHEGHIHATGKAPGGAHLYHVPTVLRHAERRLARLS
jgi:hypothetical protein